MPKLAMLVVPLFLVLLAACQSEPSAPTLVVPTATPSVLAVTSIPTATNTPVAASQPLIIIIDGKAAVGEWDNARAIQASEPDAVIGGMHYGFDATTLFIRLDARNTWADLGDGSIGVYIGTPRAPATTPTTQAGSQLGFEAGYLGELFFDSTGVSGAELKDVSGENWSNEGTQLQAKQQGTVIELAVPLKLLGKLQPGNTLYLRVAAGNSGRDVQLLPAQESVETMFAF